jgi:nucleoside phosphorylase
VPTPPIETKQVQATTHQLPLADYLVVTWTEAETDAMARVLGAGQYFCHELNTNGNNFTPLLLDTATLPLPNAKELEPSEVQCHAFYFTTKVGGKTVICLKSNFHPKWETVKGQLGVPMQNFFEWLVTQNNFKFLISSGTSGGIWPNMDVGDVVVCNSARYDPNDKTMLVAGKTKAVFQSGVTDLIGTLTGGSNQYDLIAANLNVYAADTITKLDQVRQTAINGKIPHIFYQPLNATSPNTVISDISFDMEETNVKQNNYIAYGAAFDNNDAFVAEACKNAKYNTWLSVRNISDLPGDGSNSTYNKYQDCSSVIGALTVYAFIMGH